MLDAHCPNCGAAIRFRSADLPVKVCDYCRSAVVRSGEHLQAMGRIAEVPEDVSPLQIGSRGMDDGIGFELIGRVRWRWSGGGWNEWLAWRADGSTAWIGEAMGRFMVLYEAKPGQGNAVMRRMREDKEVIVGTASTIAGTDYVVTDVKEAVCAGSEGELPFSAPLGLTIRSIDLMARDGQCASIQKDRGEVTAYIGRYASLAELRANNLRSFEDWPMPDFAA
ncbi:DUF4178 domain-containing protein [Sphingomonas sp. AR_OL41]|uniref:DUF4178 domain-containing protein n=1 Tax=Sphingomonas sp. AR_OL41 TaxID=3042729 RepID=UPI002480D4E7|nr:DUF4178 domain-containing protein [Sphingomonas sp. AR_OL41]MDH7973062.1 DUF4178 domain-containing protein [Sphingomonas sp. AR_OL41]